MRNPFDLPEKLPRLPEDQYWKRSWGGFGPMTPCRKQEKPRRVVLELVLLIIAIAVFVFVVSPSGLLLAEMMMNFTMGNGPATTRSLSELPDGYQIVIGTLVTILSTIFGVKLKDHFDGFQEVPSPSNGSPPDYCPTCGQPPVPQATYADIPANDPVPELEPFPDRSAFGSPKPDGE